MSKPILMETDAEESANIHEQIKIYFQKIQSINEAMALEQKMIDQLKMDSQALTRETRAIMKNVWTTIEKIEAA